MKARQSAVMVMAALLVSTTLVAPAAAAAPDDDDDGDGFAGDPCGRDAIAIGIDILQGNLDKSTECRIEEIRQGNKQQEMQDIHSRSETLAVYSDSFLDGQANSLEHARTVAWTKAEVAALNALENNSTQAQTRRAAISAVEEYYSILLRNLAADRNAKWEDFMYLARTVEMEELNQSTFEIDYATYDDRLNHGLGEYNLTDTMNYTLPNGSVIEFEAMHGHASGSHVGGGGIGSHSGPLVQGATWPNSDDYGPEDVEYIHVLSTFENDTVMVYNSSRWWTTIERIESQNQQMLDNLNSTVNGLYGSYVRGNLDIEEYQSTQAAAMDSSQNLRETGWMFWATHSLAQAGATVPNLSTTGSMTIQTAETTPNNSTEELTGLMVGDPPDGSGTWTVGTTYNPANSSGSLTFLVSATNRSVELSEPFTLVRAEDADGNEIAVVESQEYQYRTNNYSELGEKLDRLIELRRIEQQRIEEASNSTGGTGNIGWPGLGGAGGLALGGGVVTIAIAAVLVGIGLKLYVEVMTP
ncbi:hypothetical protein [Haloarchaeobius iranensis]|uniref:Envelope protein N-terminal domain-containing protein n=1 Tax=Haloarchaeobius iranensis TaxID=996166 RepID=A0A1H0B858_9EURY|nr:hypothetical protein [Haloarchaeobius iranensis]SDN41762.1 hypothetical protein SAMN05192554_1354 [Haloarchaeobius iranensis]